MAFLNKKQSDYRPVNVYKPLNKITSKNSLEIIKEKPSILLPEIPRRQSAL